MKEAEVILNGRIVSVTVPEGEGTVTVTLTTNKLLVRAAEFTVGTPPTKTEFSVEVGEEQRNIINLSDNISPETVRRIAELASVEAMKDIILCNL